jgi:DNA-binding NtrC family response regulator
MAEHDYPGNVRELRNLVERLAILGVGPLVTCADAEALMPRRRAAPPASSSEPTSTPTSDATPSPMPPAAPTVVVPTTRFRPGKSFRELVDEAERDIILGALTFTRDNATEAARLLDLERGHFYKKMKSLGLRRAGGETQVGAESA